MKILICVQEYPPDCSGIGNVAKAVADELGCVEHEIHILMPLGKGSEIIKKYYGLGLLFWWNKVRKEINRENDFDIIWVHNPLFLGKVKSDKVYATIHTSYADRHHNYKSFTKIYYFAMKFFEKICYTRNKFRCSVVSPQVSKEMKIDAKYIPNGVDTNKFKPPLRHGDDGKTLLCVGRMSPQKNPLALVELMSKLPWVKLVWAGDGDLRPQVEAAIKEKNLTNITLLGRVNQDIIPNLCAGADAYILTSYYEGQPLTVLEAMSCGLPCILSDIPNLNQLVKESGCGIVVDFSSPLANIKVIDYLRSKKAITDRYAARTYAKKCDWKLITEQYLKEWKKQ